MSLEAATPAGTTAARTTDVVATVRSRWLSGFLASLRENSPMLVLVLVFWIAADTLSASLGTPYRVLDEWLDSYVGYIATCFACFSAAFILWILNTTFRRNISIQTRQFWLLIVTEFASRER